MPFVIAGMVGTGGPEVLFIFLVILLVMSLIGRAIDKSKQFSRFWPETRRLQWANTGRMLLRAEWSGRLLKSAGAVAGRFHTKAGDGAGR